MDRPDWLPRLSGNYLNKRGGQMAAILAIAAALQIAAAVGLAYVAGFSQMGSTLGRFQWQWLIPLVAAFGLSFVGYYLACRGVYTVDGGPGLAPDRMRAAVIAGFGGFFAHGGAALDKCVLEAGGARESEADVRVIALGGMEHGVLGLIGAGAAIAVLVAGYDAPGPDFTLPWAVIPVPGFLFAFWAAEHYRGRLDRRRKGWRRKLALFLDGIALVNELFAKTFSRRSAVLGMTLFWLAEMFAIWAGIAAFGFKMNGAQLIVGVGTGMVFTRRTGPLAGAGVLMVCLPLTIWYSGAPLAAAVAGVFLYRVVSLWLPLPFGFAKLPRLRAMGEEQPAPDGEESAPREPALPDRKAG